VDGLRFEPTAWLLLPDGVVIVERPDVPSAALPDVVAQGCPLAPIRPVEPGTVEFGLVVLPCTPGDAAPGVLVVPGVVVPGVVVPGDVVAPPVVPVPAPVVEAPPLAPALEPADPEPAEPPPAPPPAASASALLPTKATAASMATVCLVRGICQLLWSSPVACQRYAARAVPQSGRPPSGSCVK
jgi:hypothetical protein